jgi:hypothetical protein
MRFTCFSLTFIVASNVFGMEREINYKEVPSQENTKPNTLPDDAKVEIIPIAAAGCLCGLCGKPVDESQVKEACCLLKKLCKSSAIKCSCGAFYHKECFEEVFYHKDKYAAQELREIAEKGCCLKCDEKLSTCMQRYIRCSSKYHDLLVLLGYFSGLAAIKLGLERCTDGLYIGESAAFVCLALALPSTPMMIRVEKMADEHAGAWNKWGKSCLGLVLMVGGIVITLLVH